jgi:L-alanine-DL-glutamate epimerase-like enolase superfamily enzyme
MVLKPCSPLANGSATTLSPALVRVDARWGSFGLGPAGELRAGDDAIVVTAQRGRRTGYGAAVAHDCPLGDGLEWIFRVSDELVRLTDVRAMWAFGRRRRATIGKVPSAWAAIELALLDLFAREARCSVAALVGEMASEGALPRTAVVTDEVGRDLEDVVAAAGEAGIVDFTLQLCGNVHRDRARLDAIRMHVPLARVRVRCRGLFRDVKRAYAYLGPLVRSFWAFDGVLPLATNERELAELCNALGRPLVLVDPGDVHLAASKKIPWVAELDLARAGGLLRALELARAAKAADRPVVLGTPTSTHPTEAEAYRVLARALER